MATEDAKATTIDDITQKATIWIGTPKSIALHTFFFIGIFTLHFFGFNIDQILLILTTAVSLEAIYLAIFIQMTVNRHTQSLESVEDDIEEIQEDVDELQQDVDELEEDSDLIQKDFEELSEDLDQIQSEGEVEEQEETGSLQNIQKQMAILTRTLIEIQKDINSLKKN
ncbi:hypothetical protein A3D80_00685 [Candidatus Roizmanbacteria bacterium RIFCSPHIGHO2_02_FULL_40_13b]|uniref:DUF1003 domain-containing protein n=1 Tax=Candidatus Roizmanbacteria bacterium RIFCSPHIGHO2_01_FULL_39_24 TaxID=1802032 RepID=A0A1F7GKE4_9BACT|nr:MAG: hypothetical protein A2799_02650 [Candidatus Roizmanbacteria bacterium RIFCSPHIGHO2_01_FULL_39_24]OGK27461.1 MAG: hypothetical protein A3D80_00685 [Candidatus Roizmanbacteria bacterium RIFCSPHIGHO2_02_FULL_40_13b]OGK56131.1 MAG: hypothetical protein A3H83_02335 [Candidatus Roizmanbacteria bacterium RIFCSPLOWO2_02_FULL_39_8]